MVRSRRNTGFTIIELLVVIVVIGILAAIVAASYNRSQALSRDTKRVADLRAIADSITAYRLRYGNQVEAATCTGGGTTKGSGWFNYVDGSSYTKDILTCLTEKGYLNSTYVDPFGCGSTGGSSAPGYTCRNPGYAYMKSTCVSGSQTVSVVMARLELSGNVTDLQGTNAICSSSSYATSYGMNYMIKVD